MLPFRCRRSGDYDGLLAFRPPNTRNKSCANQYPLTYNYRTETINCFMLFPCLVDPILIAIIFGIEKIIYISSQHNRAEVIDDLFFCLAWRVLARKQFTHTEGRPHGPPNEKEKGHAADDNNHGCQYYSLHVHL